MTRCGWIWLGVVIEIDVDGLSKQGVIAVFLGVFVLSAIGYLRPRVSGIPWVLDPGAEVAREGLLM